MLARLVYYSENHLGAFSGKMIGELNAIMDASNRNNEKAGITGALMFDTLWFIQVLEGERETISETLLRIAADERHSKVTVIDARPIDDRLFGNWWMGVASLPVESKIYTALGFGKRLDPRNLTGDQAVMLALDLANGSLSRRVAEPAA
jgi:Sensors of blue-light using FAD